MACATNFEGGHDFHDDDDDDDDDDGNDDNNVNVNANTSIIVPIHTEKVRVFVRSHPLSWECRLANTSAQLVRYWLRTILNPIPGRADYENKTDQWSSRLYDYIILTNDSSNNNNNGANITVGSVTPGPVKLVFKAEGPALMKLTAMQLTGLVTSTFQKHERTVLEAASKQYEREQETELRRQQDEEYQETLRQDQELEQQRTETRLEAEQEEERKREEEEQKINDEVNRLDRARSLLRDEPPKGTPGTTRIRFRLSNGKQLDRRFGENETIGSLKAFLILHFASEMSNNNNRNDCVKRVALSTNFPTRTHEDDQRTLKECDLYPQAVLMVQDLDA